MEQIVEFVETSNELEELDLSWNNFRPTNFVLLMTTLQKNGILRVLNLSWNLMIESQEQKEKSEYIYPVNNAKFFNREDWELSPSEILANRFSYMIRYNVNLQHLNLTNTGLSEMFLFSMLPALRRAKSLLSFHMGANPGINKKIQKYYMDKLRCGSTQNNVQIQI